jgi:hypothetical protein
LLLVAVAEDLQRTLQMIRHEMVDRVDRVAVVQEK